MLLLILLALMAPESRTEQVSGLYVDNGLNQTVMHRVASMRQKREIELEILTFLDLPEPSPRQPGASMNLSRVKHSAPKFLLNIYKDELEADSDLNHSQNMYVTQSDEIMTFTARSLEVAGKKGRQLWFDVSKAPTYEFVLGAELRLYRNAEAASSTENHGNFTITAYRILKPENGKRALQYINSVNVSCIYEGWVILNVSEALHHWLDDPLENKGLYLSVHSIDQTKDEVKPVDFGFAELSDERESFMVAFFKTSGMREHNVRQKRELLRNKRSDNIQFDFRRNPYIEPQVPRWSQRTCQLRTLYVSFKDLQWQDQIIAPDGYDANFCSGECSFPLNAHMNATNHAIVQSFIHLRFPGKVPKPCCAPTTLSSLSVIYYANENSIILKKYKDMVVKNCGCH